MVQAPPKGKIVKYPSHSYPRLQIMNKHATSTVSAYTGRSQDMPLPSHWYNTRTQPKANVSIHKTNSHQPNIRLQTCNAVTNPATGAAMEYHDLIKIQQLKYFGLELWQISLYD